jgi:acetyl-CoA carboxylase carboxyl transferase beta subunit
MAIDEGSVRTDDIALVGARDLDPPEREYIEEHGIDDDLARALDGADAVYVALDADVLEPGAVPVFMPAPGGLELDDVERLLLEVASGARLAGMGFTGLAPGAHPAILARFAAAAGLCRTGTKMPEVSATGNIDVSIEHKKSDPSGRDGSGGHPNTCPGCGSHYRDDELAEHLRVCPQCGHHFPVRARERVAQLADSGTFEEEDGDLRSADPLEFFDLRPYVERLAEAELGTGLGDAILTGRAVIESHPCRIAAMDFSFMGGSMGERRRRSGSPAPARRAAEDGGAPVSVSASGGARMQGSSRADQLPKTVAAVASFRTPAVVLISVLAHPTTGGVTASFASLGDVMPR